MMTEQRLQTIASWAEAWIEALAAFSHPGRMRRGRQFADKKHISQFIVRPGEVRAKVKDEGQLYDVVMEVQHLDDATWERILGILSERAIFSARLLAGEMPKEVVQVFDEIGAPLFPRAEELNASCTCVDWQVPCKHLAGLYYFLADRLEEDPFLLLQLRGRSKEDLLAALRSRHTTETSASAPDDGFVTPPLRESLAHFWDIGPQCDAVTINITAPVTPTPQLRRLGPPPFTQLDLIELLRPIYQHVTNTALKTAYQETDHYHE